tara:strand:- start:3030 stop:3806 length:777 start_codon:yes stop_codon:yes gene_type:complete
MTKLKKLLKNYNKRVDLRRIQASNGRWYINKKLKNPIPKPSMTTIDSIIDKGIAYENWLMNAKDPIKYRDYKAELGTCVHNLIEILIISGECVITDDMKGKFGENEIKKRILGFMAWWEEHNPIPLATEIRLYHKDIPWCGTVDFVCISRKLKKVVMVDFKTGNEYKSHQVQLNGYKMIWDKLFKDFPIDLIYGLYLKDTWIKKPTFSFKKIPISKDLPNYVYRLWKWANQDSKGNLIPKLPKEFPDEFKINQEESNE